MAHSDTGGSFEQFKEEFAEFVSREKELAKAELVPAAKHAGIGSGLFAGAGVFALHALWMILIGGALAVGWLLDSVTRLSTWGAFTLGFLAVAVVSLFIAFVLVKVGQLQMKKVKAPSATIAEAGATLSALVSAATGKRPSAEVTVPEPPVPPAQARPTEPRPARVPGPADRPIGTAPRRSA